MDFHIIERLGGSCRCATLFTFFIHFLHSLFSVVNYLSWVRQPEANLPDGIKYAYLSMTVVCCLFYFLGASVFYMWAWRFPEPEEIAKRRRVYGVIIHVIFCDVSMFVVETKIVWQVRFASAILGFTYVLTCLSLCYSLLRVWFFFMVRLIKFRLPTAARLGANYPALSGMAPRDLDDLDYNHSNRAAGMRQSSAGMGPGPAFQDARMMTDMRGSGGGGGVAGNTILLNRNAALYSDDGASAGMYTPVRDRNTRSDAAPGPSSARYRDPDERLDGAADPSWRGYYGRDAEQVPRSAMPPFRI